MELDRRGCVVQPRPWANRQREEPVDKAKPFDIPKREVWEAFKRVKANQGAAGVDGQSIAEFEADLSNNLYKLWNRMSLRELLSSAGAASGYSEGGRRHAPVGNSNGCGPHRPGGRPSLSGAASWSRCSTPTPMATGPADLRSMPCARLVSAAGGTTGCLIIDVKGYFDSIDWELLLKAVRHHTDCPWVLLYIERWLKAPVQMEDGSIVPRTAGTPQGGVISPLLANLFLHYAFDMWMARTYPHIPFERYADDIICHCKSAEEARALWSALADRFAACKLVLHPQKTKIVYCKDANRRGDFPNQSFDFLGFTFRARKDAGARASPVRLLPARGQPESADVHQPDDPALGASPSQRQVPARSGQDVQSVHRRLDQLLRPVLSDAVASDPEEDRCLCHPLGAPEVQAVASPDQRGARLV